LIKTDPIILLVSICLILAHSTISKLLAKHIVHVKLHSKHFPLFYRMQPANTQICMQRVFNCHNLSLSAGIAHLVDFNLDLSSNLQIIHWHQIIQMFLLPDILTRTRTGLDLEDLMMTSFNQKLLKLSDDKLDHYMYLISAVPQIKKCWLNSNLVHIPSKSYFNKNAATRK